MNPKNWLPELVWLKDSGGNWDNYLEALYWFYSKDFIEDKPVFKGNKLRIKRHPRLNGKDATFWHIIQKGEIEKQKIPELRRCERIRWPKPIIENHANPEIKVWEKRIKGEIRICIWFESFEYLVVLAKRTGYILFWTAYPVTWANKKQRLNYEYENYQKSLASS